MLPEEQLYKILRDKQAGIFGLYMQQGNLGGTTFKDDADPLQALLGQEFVDKYGEDYADTLHDTWFNGKKRLTSQTGARLMQDLNKMDARGIAALKGLAANPDKAISLIQEVNNNRVGVGGYTAAQAEKDTEAVAKQIRMAAKLRKGTNDGLFNQLAKNYVRGSLTGSINDIQKGIKDAPNVARPFIKDISKEFANNTFLHRVNGKTLPAKLITTNSTGQYDDSSYSGKRDQQSSNGFLGSLSQGFSQLMPIAEEKLGPMAKYMLPALLLGAIGGGVNSMRGGSFLAPLLLMLLLGGAYGYGREKDMFGAKGAVPETIDKITDKTNTAGKSLLEKAKGFIMPYISKTKGNKGPTGETSKAEPYVTDQVKSSSFRKFANYKNMSIIDIID